MWCVDRAVVQRPRLPVGSARSPLPDLAAQVRRRLCDRPFRHPAFRRWAKVDNLGAMHSARRTSSRRARAQGRRIDSRPLRRRRPVARHRGEGAGRPRFVRSAMYELESCVARIREDRVHAVELVVPMHVCPYLSPALDGPSEVAVLDRPMSAQLDRQPFRLRRFWHPRHPCCRHPSMLTG